MKFSRSPSPSRYTPHQSHPFRERTIDRLEALAARTSELRVKAYISICTFNTRVAALPRDNYIQIEWNRCLELFKVDPKEAFAHLDIIDLFPNMLTPQLITAVDEIAKNLDLSSIKRHGTGSRVPFAILENAVYTLRSISTLVTQSNRLLYNGCAKNIL